MTWLVAFPYAIPWIICARLVGGHLAFSMAEAAERAYSSLHRGNTGHPRLYQWVCGGVLGVGIGAIWPVLLLAVLLVRMIPTDKWAVGAEASAIKQQRDKRIAELERELNLR